jgi:hypothetical protein
MTVHLDAAYWLGLLVSVILPVLVGLVTTRVTSPPQIGTPPRPVHRDRVRHRVRRPARRRVQRGDSGRPRARRFGTGVLAHFGFWKPVGVSAKAQDSFVKAA